MLEALVLWNEPNNLSHWNFHLDPEWKRFSTDVVSPPAVGPLNGACLYSGDLRNESAEAAFFDDIVVEELSPDPDKKP